uniref:Uncharacterized protein n=1 Tax=Opuntia streptacantha TaxID=393608 RepID=A0A7C9A1R9_OPUST
MAEEVDFRATEEEAEGLLSLSRTARRSQRQEAQNPVKFSWGWRSQLVELRWGCGGCGGGGNCSSVVVGSMSNAIRTRVRILVHFLDEMGEHETVSWNKE